MFRSRVLVTALALGLLLTGCTPELAPTPETSSVAPTSAPTPGTATTPDPTPSATPIAATCDTIITAEYAASLAEQGWVSWSLPRDGIGGSPFEFFPGGPPPGSISCRYGADPDLATDNVVDLAWSPAVADVATVGAALEAAGYVRLSDQEATVYALPEEPGFYSDDEGYGSAFVFTAQDIRWALFRDEVALIRDPRVG